MKAFKTVLLGAAFAASLVIAALPAQAQLLQKSATSGTYETLTIPANGAVDTNTVVAGVTNNVQVAKAVAAVAGTTRTGVLVQEQGGNAILVSPVNIGSNTTAGVLVPASGSITFAGYAGDVFIRAASSNATTVGVIKFVP